MKFCEQKAHEQAQELLELCTFTLFIPELS